jgi:prolipoprotein diacylglyceryl transferase
MICYIPWDVSPEVFRIGHFVLRWYSGLIVIAFLTCYFLAARMIEREGDPKRIQENGTFYFLTGLIMGARLGHCFFYDPSFYLHQPLEIGMVWKGGLSSHGAIVGMMFGMWIYARKVRIPWFWFIDKLAVVFTLAGVFIRTGNLLNSEAIGVQTTVPWGFIFLRRGEDFPRHPAQLYEAFAYLAIFLWLYLLHAKKWKELKGGYITGLALITVFLLRFIIEFVKDSPPFFDHFISLNTGQVLSLPLILLGIYLVWANWGSLGNRSIKGCKGQVLEL